MGHLIASHDTLCDGESLGTLHKLYRAHCPKRSRCHWRKWQKNIGLNKLNPGFESDLESLNSKCNKRRSSMIVGWDTWFMIYELFALRTDCLEYLVKSARLATMRFSRWLVHYALMILEYFGHIWMCQSVANRGPVSEPHHPHVPAPSG